MKSKDDSLVSKLMKQLKEKKNYQISDELLKSINKDFMGLMAGKDEIAKTIKKYFEEYKYLVDTHTAVALAVSEKLDGEKKKVVLSTASPFKFSKDVYACIYGEEIEDDLNALEKLENRTGIKAPSQLSKLKDLPVRFKEVIELGDKKTIIEKLEKY